jgi:hypothetical protein
MIDVSQVVTSGVDTLPYTVGIGHGSMFPGVRVTLSRSRNATTDCDVSPYGIQAREKCYPGLNHADFCFRPGRYHRNLWTHALRPRHDFRSCVSAARLHQTALQGQSHRAVCLGLVTAGLRLRALETPACRAPATQSEEIALRGGVSVRTQLDARAASGRSSCSN